MEEYTIQANHKILFIYGSFYKFVGEGSIALAKDSFVELFNLCVKRPKPSVTSIFSDYPAIYVNKKGRTKTKISGSAIMCLSELTIQASWLWEEPYFSHAKKSLRKLFHDAKLATELVADKEFHEFAIKRLRYLRLKNHKKFSQAVQTVAKSLLDLKLKAIYESNKHMSKSKNKKRSVKNKKPPK